MAIPAQIPSYSSHPSSTLLADSGDVPKEDGSEVQTGRTQKVVRSLNPLSDLSIKPARHWPPFVFVNDGLVLKGKATQSVPITILIGPYSIKRVFNNGDSEMPVFGPGEAKKYFPGKESFFGRIQVVLPDGKVITVDPPIRIP